MFKLLRYFSITSAIALLAVALALSQLYLKTALDQLIHDTERQSAFLTRSIANAIWPRFAAYVRSASHQAPDSLIYNSRTWELHEALTPLTAGLPILKIKIYDIGGLTVYSSDIDQIGDTMADNPQFLEMASRGEPGTELSYGKSLQSIGGFVEGRDVVESYLPIRGGGGVEGVFEIYIDVTGQISEIERASLILLIGLLGLFTLLYAGLLFVMRHADRIVTAQYDNIEHKNALLTEEIDQRNKVEAALRVARDKAEAASRAKSQFLANMSHELRTPLNAVIGFSEVIADEVLGRVTPARYQEYAVDIRDSGRHLLSMVSNVLDLAKVEAGKMELHVGAFDAATLARAAARTVETNCKANGNELIVDCPASLEPAVSDEDKVLGILINLLGNAVKFTRNGRVELSVRREQSGGRNWMVFRVRDNGIGMDGAHIEEMFGEFTQADSSVTKIYGGSGLGLAISRRFASLLDGELTMDSAPGQGATITLRLPDLVPGGQAGVDLDDGPAIAAG
jgi:signal transduction histidine kinase